MREQMTISQFSSLPEAFLTLATKRNTGLADLFHSFTTTTAANECTPRLRGSLHNLLK